MNDWCPFAKRYPVDTPTTKHSDRQGHAIKAVVEHIAAGPYLGSRNWLADAKANPNSSAHFIIDRNTGELTQLVPITRAAWANGLSWKNGQWFDPNNHLVHPSWSGLIPGVNPNLITISVEHSGQPSDPWTDAELATDVRLLQWIHEQTGLVFIPHQTLIGHYEISPVDKANCPGPHCPFEKLAMLADGVGTYRVRRIPVYEGPAITFPIALGGKAFLDPVAPVEIDEVKPEWGGFGHLKSGVGFVQLAALERP